MLPRVTFHCTRGCYMAPRPSTRAVTCLPGLQPGLLHVTHSGLLCVLRTLIMVACPWLCALCTLRFAPCFRLLPHSLNYPLTHSLFPLRSSVFPRPSTRAVTWHPFRVVTCFAHLDSGCLPLALCAMHSALCSRLPSSFNSTPETAFCLNRVWRWFQNLFYRV